MAGTYGSLSASDLLSFMVVKGDKKSGGFGMNMAKDLTVTTLTVPGGPAEVAGVIPGVRIVEINGVAVSTMEEAAQAMRPTPFGEEVHFRCIPPPMKPEQGHFRPAELWGWLDDQMDRWMPEVHFPAFFSLLFAHVCSHVCSHVVWHGTGQALCRVSQRDRGCFGRWHWI